MPPHVCIYRSRAAQVSQPQMAMQRAVDARQEVPHDLHEEPCTGLRRRRSHFTPARGHESIIPDSIIPDILESTVYIRTACAKFGSILA